MRMGRVWVAVLAAVTMLGGARAQPGTDLLRKHLPPTQFETGTFQDLVVRANNEYRFIVFYIRLENDPTTKAMDARVWNNPTLAAHIRWHSLAYKFNYEGNAGLAAQLGINRKACPAVVVARVARGKLEVLDRMTTMRLICEPTGGGGRNSHGQQTFGLEIDTGDIPDIYPGTLKVLQNCDFEVEAVRARDPIWGAEHDRRNPEPAPPPDPDPLHEVEDADAVRVPDPEPLTGTPDIAGWIDVYDRLNDARESAAAGDIYLATGLYTWLWEKGEKADPSFRAAKRSVVAEEMRELALRNKSARNRFKRLRAHYDERLLWTTYERLGDWFLLNGVVNDELETVAYLDLFINDLDEGSMLPDCDKIAYRLLVGRGYWNDGWDLGERPALPPTQLANESKLKPVVTPVTRRAAQLVQKDAGGRGMGMDERDRKKIDDFRDVYAVDECARLHAACLRAGREDDAWKVANTLIGARPEPAARLSLVAAAVAAGQVRQRHFDLLQEAAAEGSPHPVLKARVIESLRASGAK